MEFEFATASRIVFGNGKIRELGQLALEFGNKALLVTNENAVTSQTLLDEFADRNIDIPFILIQHDIDCAIYQIASEPTLDMVADGITVARENNCKLVISLGGGSAIDAGKAISSMLANQGDLLDYLEVIGSGKKLAHPSFPFIAIPTTAGTGAEVTRNAVLKSLQHGVKVSLRSPFLLPKLALIDPELTYGLPPDITASTGLDALTQLIEPFVSIMANPLTDGLCREGIRRAARSLKKVYFEGHDIEAREDMSIASLLGGICLANAKLGAVHAFAGVIGGKYHAPHGAICACLLPHVMAINLAALLKRMPDSPVIARYDEIARILTGRSNAHAQDGIIWLLELTRSLQIPSLTSYGINKVDFQSLIEGSLAASSMKGNPILLTRSEIEQILLFSLNSN